MILRAIEDKRFLPVGADQEVMSEFQLIAGTNRDLGVAIEQGRFRDDLYARLNLWSFALPGLKERREDIEPNLDFELKRFAARRACTSPSTARRASATSPSRRRRKRKFRDLGASLTRMATLAPSGRITEAVVAEEIARLSQQWRPASDAPSDVLGSLLGADRVAALDLFDRVQLAEVVRICRQHSTLSAAGGALFAASRAGRASVNDADRLRKYLARFGLDWSAIAADRR